jgi:pSer/pThr/pTyr-binding forkhead associated (FHA) protein
VACIRIDQGPDLARRFVEFDKPQVVFGRSPDCDVLVPGPPVSREHFNVFRHEDRWCIEDLSSHSGTWVNDVQIKGCPPRCDGDQIRVCSGGLVFIDDEPQDP